MNAICFRSRVVDVGRHLYLVLFFALMVENAVAQALRVSRGYLSNCLVESAE